MPPLEVWNATVDLPEAGAGGMSTGLFNPEYIGMIWGVSIAVIARWE